MNKQLIEEAANKYAKEKSSSSVFTEQHKSDFKAGAEYALSQQPKDIESLRDECIHLLNQVKEGYLNPEKKINRVVELLQSKAEQPKESDESILDWVATKGYTLIEKRHNNMGMFFMNKKSLGVNSLELIGQYRKELNITNDK